MICIEGRGDPDAAWQKFVSTITGRKIQKFDLEKIMNQKAGNFSSTIKGDLTLSEDFYRSSDWETRGPKQIKNEFEQQMILYNKHKTNLKEMLEL